MRILLSHLVPPGLICISHRTVAGTSKCCMRCCYCYHSFPSSFTHVHASLILKSEAKPSLNITGIRFTCVLPPPAQRNVPKELSVLLSANFLCPWPSLFPQRHTGAALSKGPSWQAALRLNLPRLHTAAPEREHTCSGPSPAAVALLPLCLRLAVLAWACSSTSTAPETLLRPQHIYG